MDLNLIPSFCALLEEKHVSRAAERCNITQPAMSRMFNRLRETFQDDLLVRSGRRYERTPRGEQLLSEMQDVLARIDSAISGDRFEPERCETIFRLATTDYISAVFMPLLLADIETRAPLATLDLQKSDDRTFESVVSGRIDAAMVSTGEPPATLRKEKLFDEEYACIVAADHPLKRRRFALKQYVEQRHIVIDVVYGLQPAVDKPLEMYGARRRVGYRTPFLSSAVFVAAATSMVLTVPLRLAEVCARGAAVRVVAAPPEIEHISYSLLWHDRLEASRAHAWFRDRIRSVAVALAQPAKRGAARSRPYHSDRL
jgi:DNA-binding transcriptional LysR family regulator